MKAKPTATGGPPATFTMTMCGQIDIGWAVVPFGLLELQDGKIRVIARGPDVPTLRNQTIRVQIVNANALKDRKDVMVRFMRAYRESIDWMYSNPLAVKYYAETIKQPESLVVMQRDQYNPKEALSPDRLSDIDQVMADAVEMKFLECAAEQSAARGIFPDSGARIVNALRMRRARSPACGRGLGCGLRVQSRLDPPVIRFEPRRFTPGPERSDAMLADEKQATSAVRRLAKPEAALDALYGDISAKNMFPFWATSTDVAHDEIKQLMGTQKAVPHLWSYKDDIETILFRAAELVTMDNSERRSLILVNPGLSPRRATVSTMYTAYRLNDANEVMPPHRHSPNAIRFGLTGKGNFTGVGGEDITFGPGDMVLTPVDTWHNHGNVGNEPAVNLSVLDLPLVETLNAVYFEHDYTEMVDGKPVKKKQQTPTVPSDYSARAYDHGGLKPRFLQHQRGAGFSSPMYVYRWETMQELIERFKDWDGDPYEAISIEYVDPLTGGPVFKTMTFLRSDAAPGRKDAPGPANRKPPGGAVRGQRPHDHRRQALRLAGI